MSTPKVRKQPLLSAFHGILLLILMGGIGVVVFSETRETQRNRALLSEMGTIASRLAEMRDRMNDPDPVADPQGMRRAADLERLSARVAELEASVSEWERPASPPLAVLGPFLILIPATFAWFVLSREDRGITGVLLMIETLGFALVSVETDSIVSINPIQSDRNAGRPVVVLGQPDGNAAVQPAYAVPFENGSDRLDRLGEQVVRELATALRPCVAAGSAEPLILAVTGFASSAPFSDRSRPESNRANRQLAEARSHTVSTQLQQELCRPRGCRPGSLFVKPDASWLSYNNMAGNVAAGDQSEEADSRTATELLNRTALVIVQAPGRCTTR